MNYLIKRQENLNIPQYILEEFLNILSINEMPYVALSTDDKPEDGCTPGESGNGYECVMAYLQLARRKKKAAYFGRGQNFCPGGQLYINVIDKIPEFIAPYVSTGFGNILGDDSQCNRMQAIQNFFKKLKLPPDTLINNVRKAGHIFSEGIESIYKGERFCKNPEIAQQFLETVKLPPDIRRYRVFKPITLLEKEESPEIIIFFVDPDKLSGLFNLVQYYTGELDSVISPWGAGCTSIYGWVKKYMVENREKAVLGGFDVVARPFMSSTELSLSMPYSMFNGMVECFKDSFLYSKSWNLVKKRIDKKTGD